MYVCLDGYIYIYGKRYLYIDLAKINHDLTVPPNPGNHGLDTWKSSPFLAARFRLVNQ